ncbi:LysM peptidoglycan-binding domain-containing protein [Paenibacillus vini]|uniref:Peptidoglycan-binding protein LysM n=1 Tax=Paenibacillus vini TaxID=1476024 RepID=A0ABQ4MIZ7_9BACL|nr:LysM peptidoglycan-binding domain-containing protein [Paenibacillus vini]GIP55964.1 peptidoglycan-binding protein LysM [Paenibacillus vini]
MNDYSMMLSYNNRTEVIEFPVLPESIEIPEPGSSKTFEISNLGEINVFKGLKLREISFESFFPANWFPGASVTERELFEPKHYVEAIQKWRKATPPMEFVFAGSTLDLNMLVTIEKFTWSEDGGAVGDIKFQITFKEYRPYAARKVQVQTTSGSKTVVMNKNNSAPARPDTRVKPKTYTLVAGDNLWKVAQKVLGDGSKYKQIQTLNGIKDSELKKLPVGKVLKLP